MRKIFTEDLPKWKEGRNKGKINWEASIGLKIRFIYNEISGYLEILKYNKKRKRVLVKYKNNIQDMDISHLKKLAIKNLLEYKYCKGKPLIYKYKVGEIIRIATGKIEIIEKRKKKMKDYTQKRYLYKCLNDGYIEEIAEHYIKETYHCPVCINQKILKGINDIATTHPYLIKYFSNIEDAYTHSYGYSKKILLKCPNCGYEKNMILNHLIVRGFSCPKCGDKISYPEKFFFNVVAQLNIDFLYQLTSKNLRWCNKYKYDFYFKINNEEYIIETHGLQHYENNYSFSKKIKIENIIKNDKLKKQLALQNGIKEDNYIVIDCRKQELNFIKNSIIKSKLNTLFDLSKVNWLKCHEFACSSLVKKACNMWKGNFECMKTICEKLKLSRPTIIKYLKQGEELGWCNYDPKINMQESCRKNGKSLGKKTEIFSPMNKSLGVFTSATEISRISEKEFGVKLGASAISSVCRKELNSYKKFTFKYVE